MTAFNSSITCELLHDSTVNYAVQQNHVPIIKRLRITNTGGENLSQVTVALIAEPEFATRWETVLAVLPCDETLDLGVVDLQLAPAFLAGLTERMAGKLTVTVACGESILHSTQSPIDILAYDEWNGTQTLPEIIAAFVTPNHPEISRLLRQVANLLGEWTGTPSLDAYQSKDPKRVRLQLAAIFSVLQAQNIAYCVPPASFEEQGQKIRLPDAIQEHKLATCLDLAVLFTACAEAAGLHPLIIFTQGHAFFGTWLVEETFSESLQDDITLLTKRIAPGVQEIFVVEATALAAGKGLTFDQAVAAGEANLHHPEQFHFFIDISRARMSRIRPLPLRVQGQAVQEAENQSVLPEGTAIPGDEEGPISIIPAEQIDAHTRLEQWERRLLDLTLRNPLLNFRITGASIPLLTAELSNIEDALADGQDFQVHPRPGDWEGTPRDAAVYQGRAKSDPQLELLRAEFGEHRLRADLPEKDLGNRLTQLYRTARNSLEENGTNTLFLALGMLVWYETNASQKPRYAPILLIPMEIIRKSVQTGYLVRKHEDEPQLNVTLAEMLKQDFGVEIKGLNPLPTDEHGIDVKKVLTIIRRAIMHQPRWDVLEDAYLGLFSFSKFIMWHDLKVRTEELKRNKVVASLIDRQLTWSSDEHGPAEDHLDATYHPKDLLCPISADSSQLAAICSAGSEKSIVLHGPPGTGKSQTITNIIAHALAHGKSVLFVAEKMAALSVVQRRLTQIGLAPFCLEVHSNKSKKKDVLEQLRQALEIGRASAPQSWEAEANRLKKLRDELNEYVHALHRPRKIGHSVFHAIARLAEVHEAPTAVRFTSEQVVSLTPEQLQMWGDIARQIRVAGEACGHPHGHPWAAAQRQDYTPQLRSQAADALAAFLTALEHWRQTMPPIAELFHLSEQQESYRDISALLELSKRFQSVPTIPGSMVRAADWDETFHSVETWITHGRTRDGLRTEVYARYAEGALALDTAALQTQWRQANQQWLLPRWLGCRRVTQAMRRHLNAGIALSKDRVETDLVKLQRLHEEEAVLNEAGDRARELLGRLWQDGQPDWDAVVSACGWTGEVRKLAGLIAGTNIAQGEALREHWAKVMTEYRDQLDGNGVVGQQLLSFIDAGNAFIATWQALSQLLQLPQQALIDDQLAPGWFGRMAERATRWQENLDGLRDWCAWMRIRTLAATEGLQSLISSYEQGLLNHNEVEPAFTRGLYQAWTEQEVAGDKVLSSFSCNLFEDKVRQFRELDDRFSELTKQEIYARAAARIPRGTTDPSQNSEMGILQRELLKQRNHLALRVLFQKIPNALTRLKPCLLMSPMSVAQYLDPAHPPFDLVIFDEASQVPTCDAVGAIARGKEVVIVGDPKQLPPTSFFASMNGDDDAEFIDSQDLESILDDCLALRMPEESLRWHYRSQHESLIAFSNYQYYDNKLYTFPSPDDLTPAVRWCPVEGVYDRGKSKQNRSEAEAVVKEIVRRLSDPVLSQSSIGVVTFSQVQQRLIEDLLDEQRRQSPELETFFSSEVIEPVFVKNLENVQGDERDVILFSIGYGPDAQGRVSMNFGPLNKEGGWRRLNVAVSRARQEMLVFSTLRADQLDTSRTSAKGVADLKAFLEYAQFGKKSLLTQRSVSTDEDCESLFEEQVCGALRQRGHIVHTQVGCSSYRIDLAVVDPERPGRYLLGIECDGATYHRAKTARDRDKLREMVLRKLGWELHRVWSTDWWENQERELQRIEEAIIAAKDAGSRKPVTEPSPVYAKAAQATLFPTEVVDRMVNTYQSTPTTAAVPYTIYNLPKARLTAEYFYFPTSSNILENQIVQVVNAEGPISFSLLCRRVINAWGMSQVGSRIRTRMQEVITSLRMPTTRRGAVTFYWPKEIDRQEYAHFRVPSNDRQTRRDPEDLPPEEIAIAALEVLYTQISLPEPDLIREVARLFGYQRTGPSVEECLKSGVELILKSGRAKREDDGRIVQV